MKQVELNPLQRELARGQQAGLHPDADLLTGFAEGRLLEREREEIFAHLAGCAECREVLNVAVAAGAPEDAELKPFLLPHAGRSPLRKWLPWMGLAAGIILVCSVGLLYRQRLEMKQQAGTDNTAQMSTASQPMPPVAAESNAGANASAAKPRAETLKNAEPEQDAAPMASAGETPGEGLKQSDASAQNSQLATQSAGATNEESFATPSARASAQVQAQMQNQTQNQNPNQIQYQAQAPAENLTQAQAQLQPAPAFVAQKPARAFGKLTDAAASARPTWRIDSTGAVERTFGEGLWQKVLTDEKAKMRVVSVSNADVWVGGEDARLYHSADGGVTWNAVTLPVKSGHDHAIVHISFQTRQAGVVTADDGTSWSTTDGGVSWK